MVFILILAILVLYGCENGKSSGFLLPLPTTPASTKQLTEEWEGLNERAAQTAQVLAESDEKIWGKGEISEEKWCKQHWFRSIYFQCIKHSISVGSSRGAGSKISSASTHEPNGRIGQ